MGKYKSQWTGPQIDEGVGAARNPDTVPTNGSDALITSDAVEKVQQGFAPIESDATASQAYAVGDLLVWGGILYKAKTAITIGDSFTVGTNIEATTIADKLNNIDTQITSNTDTTLTGVLTGNGSKVGSKALDTSSLTNDTDHVPVSSVVKSALDNKADQTDLASIHATGSTNTTGATITKGTFFYLDGALVRAKADIAANATFTSGTNYETITVGGFNALRIKLASVQLTTSAYGWMSFPAGHFVINASIGIYQKLLPVYYPTGGQFITRRYIDINGDGDHIFNLSNSTTYTVDYSYLEH